MVAPVRAEVVEPPLCGRGLELVAAQVEVGEQAQVAAAPKLLEVIQGEDRDQGAENTRSS